MRTASFLIALGLVGSIAACTSAGGVNSGSTGSSGNNQAGGSAGKKGEPVDNEGGEGGEGGEQSEGGAGGTSAGSGGSAGDSFGGSGGSIELGGEGGSSPIETCAAVGQKATSISRPIDIIWAIDTSGSMDEEAAFVQSKLNAFAGGILNLGIDVRVVMLAESMFCLFPGFCPDGICIPAPLGSGNCPNDTKAPLFFHPNVEVASNDGLKVLIDSYPTWKKVLRVDSMKMIIAVTDDDATTQPYTKSNFPDGAAGAAKKFIEDFTALDPVMLKDWKVNGIYSFTQCQSAASIGETWDALVDLTGGVKGDLCTQNFQPIFNDIAKAIAKESKLDCEWTIPPPPDNQSFDPNQVNVKFTSGAGKSEDIYYVNDASKCDAQKGGWYFDNPSNPKHVIACPSSCSYIQKDSEAKIDIMFGCTRIPLPVN